MLVYLLRHAEAVSQAESDHARTLTEKGIEQARRAGRFCHRHGIVPDMILSSPLRRAEQTARLAAAEIGVADVRVAEFLASGMEPETAREELRSFSELERVMLVGHEPDFSSFIAKSLHAAADRIHVGKASLTALELSGSHLFKAVLRFSVPAKLM